MLRTAPINHPARTRRILLEGDTLNYVSVECYNLNLGQTFTFHATGVGSDKEIAICGTFAGDSHSESARTYLSAYCSGGQLNIEWVGRVRLDGRAAYN
ncbi:hypothetical protein ACCI51_18810 [Microbulbifer echini]|uniref:Uncharacterized protein n=1 Tax=Microbulbifer echini TaxID=1529067 RepID=A0ABV4NT66_9GAMM